MAGYYNYMQTVTAKKIILLASCQQHYFLVQLSWLNSFVILCCLPTS